LNKHQEEMPISIYREDKPEQEDILKQLEHPQHNEEGRQGTVEHPEDTQ